jgi:hypothetical protein
MMAPPDLRDRRDVLDRLAELYGAWGKPQEQAAVTAQLARTCDPDQRRASRPAPPGCAAAVQETWTERPLLVRQRQEV